MIKVLRGIASVCLFCGTLYPAFTGQGASAAETADGRESESTTPLTVAALPFDNAAADEELAPLAEAIGDMLMVRLSAAESLVFVERAALDKLLAEHSSGNTRTINDGKVQIDFHCPPGYHSLLFEDVQVKPDGAWHVFKLEPGIRAIHRHRLSEQIHSASCKRGVLGNRRKVRPQAASSRCRPPCGGIVWALETSETGRRGPRIRLGARRAGGMLE